MSKRKQIRIPGTERPDHPEIEERAFAVLEIDSEFAALSRKKKMAKLELGAVMKAANVVRYKFYDAKIGKYRCAKIDPGEEKIAIEETDESIAEVGAGVETAGESGIPQGLIDQALRDADSNVEVSSDGDVVVPDKAAPKAKKGRRKKS